MVIYLNYLYIDKIYLLVILKDYIIDINSIILYYMFMVVVHNVLLP